MRRKIIIVADCPDETSREEIAQFVQEAVSIWGGQRRPPGALNEYDPGDPLFESLDVESVTVTGCKFTFVKET